MTPSEVHDFLEPGIVWLRMGIRKIIHVDMDTFYASPAVDSSARLGPCVARPSKIVCIGLNYARHALEGGAEVPKEPVLFLKAPSVLSGPNDDLIIPKGSEKTDWEVELAVVVGKKRAAYIRLEESMGIRRWLLPPQ